MIYAVYFLSLAFLIVILLEVVIYYVVLYQCNWPKLSSNFPEQGVIKAMIIADTHLLGPIRGHWFDKLRREWQMHQSFWAAMKIFTPEVIFFLGDLFDEGDWVNNKDFQAYVKRFFEVFPIPSGVKSICIVGNHDIGFHYKLHPVLVKRFEENFNNTGVSLNTIKNVHFITINSMAIENDGCSFCEKALNELKTVSNKLNCAKHKKKCGNLYDSNLIYSQPVILQHFPTFRHSDKYCTEYDSLKIEAFRETWEVLSKSSTDLLGRMLNPRVFFSGHSHSYCRTKNRLEIEEFTVSSFNWRNRNNPSFLLAKFTSKEYSVELCYLPKESVVIKLYMILFAILFFSFILITIVKYQGRLSKTKIRKTL